MAQANTQDAAHDAPSKNGKNAKSSSARDAAYDRARTAAGAIESNPVGVLVGGIAVGLLAGALVPRSERERNALRPVGKRLVEGATAALSAAKETGKEQLTASVVGRDAAKEGARKVFDSAFQAAKGNQPA